MDDETINNIIRQATRGTTISEEIVADPQAAFLEALGETPETTIQTQEVTVTPTIEEEVVEETIVETEPINPVKIPLNSSSILVDETTSRFSSAIWYQNIQDKVIILAGLGGIGSYIAFLLSRMKPRALYIYDDDVVEAANMSGQLYSKDDVGKYKVNAMVNMVSKYADYNSMFAFTEKFTMDSEAADIMICGFDNMTARKIFFNKWKDHVFSKDISQRNNCLFIDGRLAAESIQVLCIKGDSTFNIDNYEHNWLFDDYEADETVCSYKQTTFCANMIGSIITNLFVNFCANQCNPLMERDLPFITSYEAETMYFKTEN